MLLVILGLVALPLIALAVANTRPAPTAAPSLSDQLTAWQRSHPGYTCSITSQTDQTITADCKKDSGGASSSVGRSGMWQSETVTAVSLTISNGTTRGAGFVFSPPNQPVTLTPGTAPHRLAGQSAEYGQPL